MRIPLLLPVFLSLLSFSTLPAKAADEAKKAPPLTKEERAERADRFEKLASVHKRMAECLRSDRPMSECHDEMRKECPMAEDGHCPMVDGAGRMRGRRGR